MKRKAIIAAIAAATLSAGAYAADVETATSGSANASGVGAGVEADAGGFTQLDSNSDGQLSRDEAQGDPRLSSQWDNLDANRDGNVDESEFSAFEGNAPSQQSPQDRPSLGGPQSPGADQGLGATPPGQSTDPGASEAAPGQL